MKEVTMLLPTFTNEGVAQRDVVDSIVRRICKVSGGVSAWMQDGIEVWEDAIYSDPSLRVVTVVDSLAKVHALRNIAIDAIDLLHQRGGIFFQVHTMEAVEWLSREDKKIAIAA